MDVVYTVKSGDWMAKIAEEHGTSVSAIWNHPDNAGHRAKRGSPDVLYPGDVLVVPSALAPSPPPGGDQPAPPEVVPVSPPGVAPWPFPPPKAPPPSSLPTWSCPEGVCVCHPADESDVKVPHTIVFYDPSGHRMPGARCMIYELGRPITSPATAANGAGELVIELGHMGWARQFNPPASREGAYVVPRLVRSHGDDGATLRNVYIFPGVPRPGGDGLKGWADITHPKVPFPKLGYDDNAGTEEDYRAMKALLRRLPEDVRRDRERCLAIQQAGSAQPSPTT